jgi:farnesyl-diphosphate farnesyltransferase
MLLMTGAVIGTLVVVSLIMVFAAWLMGARFDLAYDQIRHGSFRPTTSVIPAAPAYTTPAAHEEL